MSPQYRCHRAGADPVAGEAPRCDSTGSGRIRRAPPAALAELLCLALADRRERASRAVRLHQAIALLDRFPPSILQLMFRVAIAAVFWSSGLTKIASWDTTIALFRDEYMVPLLPPEIAAAWSAAFELSCSPLIVVGLATRLATLPLLGMTFVIQTFVYPEYSTQHLMWASVLLFLLTKGPGVFSLDHYVERLFRTKGLAR